jgi:aryl-alcohol dehydrogenase-like predicted oxidoreductase
MFTNITIGAEGVFSGREGTRNFSAQFSLFLIRRAWDEGCDFEDLADGFGPDMGTMGGDWSGIRDSSHEAVERMFERALNFFFS